MANILIPSLATTLAAVLQAWQNNDPGPGCRTVGWAVGLGRYDFYQGRLWRLTTTNGIATRRLATAAEIDDVLAAILSGSFQIENQPVSGIIGGQGGAGTSAQAMLNTVVLHQATGRAL